MLKFFYCSKQGFKNNEPRRGVAYEIADSRIGYETRVEFMWEMKEWKITKFVMNQNNDFVPPKQRHLLHSIRSVSTTKGDPIKSMLDDGMRVTNNWSYWGEVVSGFDNSSSRSLFKCLTVLPRVQPISKSGGYTCSSFYLYHHHPSSTIRHVA